MAKAEFSTYIRTIQQPVEITEKMVILTLTEEEAKTLAVVVGAVGGSPTKSRRKHTDFIWRALAKAGVPLGYELENGAPDALSYGRVMGKDVIYFVEYNGEIAN